MNRKLVFSERYAMEPIYDLEETPDPMDWLPDFQDPWGDRNMLADRLIQIAGSISRGWHFDMDIYDSPVSVDIDLFLDESVYCEDYPKQLAALLSVCDECSITACRDRTQIVFAMHYNRE